MNMVYTATVVAIFVTTSLATNLLVVGTRGPVTPGLPVRLRSSARRLGRRLRHFTNTRVAAMIQRRERLAARSLLCRMTDRELKDMGFYRGTVGLGDSYVARVVGERVAYSVSHAEEEQR